jgi:hypothetical protein
MWMQCFSGVFDTSGRFPKINWHTWSHFVTKLASSASSFLFMDIILPEDAWEIEQQLELASAGMLIRLEKHQADRVLDSLPENYFDLLCADCAVCVWRWYGDFRAEDWLFRLVPFHPSLPLAHVLSLIEFTSKPAGDQLSITQFHNYLLPFVNLPILRPFKMAILETHEQKKLILAADFMIIEFLREPAGDTVIEIKRDMDDPVAVVFQLSDLISTPCTKCIFLMPLTEDIIEFQDIANPGRYTDQYIFPSIYISSDMDAVLVWSF